MTDYLVHAALTTPFGEDGWVDVDALRAHVELLVDDGVDGVVPAGTTGEGPLLEESEVAAVVATAVQAAAGRIEVIAHVGRASTQATLRLARAATGSGADALMAVTPYYYGHSGAALRAHYGALLDAADGVPVLAYAIPARAGNELSAELLDALAGDGIAGVKDSTGSPERHAQYLEVARRHAGLRVFVGSARLTLESMRGGATGTISALANARADALLRLRAERSDEAQAALERVREELPEIADLKRAVSERLPELGVSYPTGLRAPLGG